MDTTSGTQTTHAGESQAITDGDIPRPINLSSRSRSPTPPPTDSLSSLHRVTDMLKDKLNGKKDFLETSDHESSHSRKSPYHQQQSTSSATERKNGCVSGTMDGPYPTLPPHHMSMLLGNDVYGHNADSANVLRGILQGKEMMEESEKHLRNSKRFSELYGREDDKKARSCGGDSDVDSYRSGSPENMSFDDSDPDRRINGVSDMDEIVGDASKASINGDNEDSFMDGQLVNGTDDEESSDVKKSRSDGMHSSILPSGKTSNTDGLLTPPERRPKRKQYIPQQHGSLEPTNKLRKVEKEVLQNQLKQMQKQLFVMQQRYCELFDQGEVPDLPGLEGTEDERSESAKCKNSEKHRFMGSLDFDPSHFIKQANKLVQEQEMLSKNSDGSSSLLSGKSPSDMQNLARMLKDELANSVNSLVDNVVAKFVEKQEKLPSPRSPVAAPAVFKPKKEQTPAPANESETPKPKCPTPTGALNNNNNNNNDMKDMSAPSNKYPPSSHALSHHSHDSNGFPKPPRTKVTDKINHPFFDFHPKPFSELARAHPALFPPPPYFPTQIPPIQPLYAKEPEQTEAMSLVLGTPNKKKRTKVTDTRLSPRAARALLQESLPTSSPYDGHKHAGHMLGFSDYGHPMIPMSLPTSVAIPNPSLQHSDILAMYSNSDHSPYLGEHSRRGHSPSTSPSMGHTPIDSFHPLKDMDNFDQVMSDNYSYEGSHAMTSTLTPMHLRKAKLMFFYVRYPSSSILKIYFPDIKFNKNNTAQLVKWFSNFREFYYIQMEKYARQALAEGVKNAEELVVTTESELYRILNLHYNRNNQIDVPDHFRGVVQSTLREFFRAIQGGKDAEQSWKKAIYKVIARMDDTLPEYFKSPNWMEQLNDA